MRPAGIAWLLFIDEFLCPLLGALEELPLLFWNLPASLLLFRGYCTPPLWSLSAFSTRSAVWPLLVEVGATARWWYICMLGSERGGLLLRTTGPVLLNWELELSYIYKFAKGWLGPSSYPGIVTPCPYFGELREIETAFGAWLPTPPPSPMPWYPLGSYMEGETWFG